MIDGWIGFGICRVQTLVLLWGACPSPDLTHSCAFLCLSLAQIWVRHYQIVEEAPANAKEAKELKEKIGEAQATSLVEIGPRLVLNPIRIFRGSFGGQTLFQNPNYISPNEIRSMQKRNKGMSYEERKESKKQRQERHDRVVVPEDPLASTFTG